MRLIATMAAILALASSALALKLETGEYSLSWVTDVESPFAAKVVRFVPGHEEGAPQIKGSASEDLLWGSNESLTLIADETAGTSTGYDAVYVALDAPKTIDLSHATKIVLNKDGEQWTGSGSVTIATGPATARVQRQAAVSVVVYSQAEKPFIAVVRVGSGWKGNVRTDSGEITAELYDLNGNGIYGDKMPGYSDGSARPDAADVMVLGGFQNLDNPSSYGNIVYLSDVVSYGGDLYVFDIGNGGESVRVSPYTGPRGRLKIQGVNGYGKGVPCSMSMMVARTGVYTFVDPRDEIVLPAGELPLMVAELSPEPSLRRDDQLRLALQLMDPLVINAGKTTVAKIGGVVSIEINPAASVVTAAQGSMLRVEVAARAGACSLIELAGREGAIVNIRDPRGKVISSGVARFGQGLTGSGEGAYGFTMEVPADWKPGTYRIGASLNLSPYYKTVFATKELKVVKGG